MNHVDIYHEVLDLASQIRDRYLRAITYARIGYYLYKSGSEAYKDAFKLALEVVSKIENPLRAVMALVEIGSYIQKCNLKKAAMKIFYQAHEVIREFPQPLHDEMLETLVTRLIELGVLDDALFYSRNIKDNVKRNDILLKILKAYLKEENMKRAYITVKYIQGEPWHSIAAIETLKVHLKREEFGSAIKILKSLKSEYWLSEAMREVAVHLKNANVPKETYEKFVDIALSMPGSISPEVLRSLLIGLGSYGETSFVVKVIHTLSEEEKIKVLSGLISNIIDQENLLEELAENLDKEEFDLVAKIILDELLSRTPELRYKRLVEKLGFKTRDEPVKAKSVTYLSKLREYNSAMKLAKEIEDTYVRSLAFGSIAVSMLREGNIDRAIDAALEVKDPKWGSWLLSEILTKILELQAGENVGYDLEHKAHKQKKIWERESG
ncbi:hypothetical protein [Thermococcus sp.]